MARPSDPEITIKISMQKLNEMLMLLGKAPFEQVADLLLDLRNQAQEQLNQMNAQTERAAGPRLVDQPPSG